MKPHDAAVLTTDEDWIVLTANQEANEIFGDATDGVVGRALPDLVRCPSLFDSDHGPLPQGHRAAATVGTGRRTVELTVIRQEATTRIIVLRDLTERAKLQREMLGVAEREQRRIGRDLHDGLSQHMVGLSMLARALARRLQQQGGEDAEAARRIAELVAELVATTREMARGLYPLELETKGLVEALQVLASRAQSLTGVRTEMRQYGAPPVNLHIETATHLYRIAQEAINNAARHAGATSIQVSIDVDATGVLTLSVMDDGQGLPSQARRQGGMGLRVMAERASMIGARLSIEPGPRRGTAVRCVLERAATAQ